MNTYWIPDLKNNQGEQTQAACKHRPLI
jgi:hypothetical protein